MGGAGTWLEFLNQMRGPSWLRPAGLRLPGPNMAQREAWLAKQGYEGALERHGKPRRAAAMAKVNVATLAESVLTRLCRLAGGRASAMILACVLALPACTSLPSSEIELDRVWARTVISVPAAMSRSGFPFEREVANMAAPGGPGTPEAAARPGALLPAVIFLHGCEGSLRHWPDFLVAGGFAVFTPNSFARAGRQEMCGRVNRATIELRHAELRSTLRRIRGLPWVDRQNLFLVGHSEGGMATALWGEGGFNAYVVSGWSCHTSAAELRGLWMAADKPVLGLVVADDPHHAHPDRAGHCGAFMQGRSGSASIVFHGLIGHGVVGLEHEGRKSQDIVLDFLRANISRSAAGAPADSE